MHTIFTWTARKITRKHGKIQHKIKRKKTRRNRYNYRVTATDFATVGSTA